MWVAQATSPCMDQYRPVGDLGCIGTTRRDAKTGCYGFARQGLKPSRTRLAPVGLVLTRVKGRDAAASDEIDRERDWKDAS